MMEENINCIDFPCGENVLDIANDMVGRMEEAQKLMHWVLFYNSEWDSNVPPYRVNVFVRQKPPKRFNDIYAAMDCYSNYQNPASQMIHGNSVEEMEYLTEEMDKMMADKDWVEENLAPLL